MFSWIHFVFLLKKLILENITYIFIYWGKITCYYNPATFNWIAFTKTIEKNDHVCVCVRGIDFASWYDFSSGFWNSSDSVVYFVFHFFTINNNKLKYDSKIWYFIDNVYLFLWSQWVRVDGSSRYRHALSLI